MNYLKLTKNSRKCFLKLNIFLSEFFFTAPGSANDVFPTEVCE